MEILQHLNPLSDEMNDKQLKAERDFELCSKSCPYKEEIVGWRIAGLTRPQVRDVTDKKSWGGLRNSERPRSWY